MKPRARIATWQRLRQQPTWKLLAADNAPLIAALLRGLLLDNERQLPTSLLHERLARELEELRAHGHAVPRSAQAYVAEWLGSGWLERRFPEGARIVGARVRLEQERIGWDFAWARIRQLCT